MKGRLPWIAPAMILLLALSIFPLIYSLKLGLKPAHFERMFHDRLFHIALWQTLLFTALALTAEFVLGLSLALLIDGLGRAARLFRAGLLMPMLLPPVVAAVAWRLIFNPQFGVLNGTLKGFGLDTSHLTWTNGEGAALLCVVLVDIWEWTPFLFLLLSAGLQSLPQEPLEAARVDGASWWQTTRDITLPLLKPVILLALLLRSMDLIRIFDQIFILTQGGPGFATETVSLYIYRTAFRFGNFGYAAAMSFVMLAITTVMARSLMRVMKTK
jgi:multiple sugar transport system permease protein